VTKRNEEECERKEMPERKHLSKQKERPVYERRRNSLKENIHMAKS
jgi:hypothetical protein